MDNYELYPYRLGKKRKYSLLTTFQNSITPSLSIAAILLANPCIINPGVLQSKVMQPG